MNNNSNWEISSSCQLELQRKLESKKWSSIKKLETSYGVQSGRHGDKTDGVIINLSNISWK